ncbi:MarR family transcriptional regulator [Paenibacillus sp. LMG 31459]|uniref:MarR family transcriptional regulator n=1 Tax=Paenibacillus phytohabitans TaxID=2654978 RepID=A0ABX1YGG4_9BACL|nr:MarR family transcriptional regulator [Paenibacillus phytohabitans]NOU79449.1 MarR family transcriptional regulator [Paenibacillus phytohabitans]
MLSNEEWGIVDRFVDLNSSLNRKFNNLIRAVVGDALTVEQYTTLAHIQQAGSCTSSELAAEFGVKKSAVTSIINRLFEKEWVQRDTDPKDRRNIYLSLTDQGRTVFTETDLKIRRLVQPVIHEFQNEEIVDFLNQLERLDLLIGSINKANY